MSSDLLKLDVGGMTCAACVASVEKIVERSEYVKAVAVNLPLNSASVKLTQSVNDAVTEEIISAINNGGFTATRHDKSKPLRERLEKQVANDGRKAGLALVLALPTIYLTMFADDMGNFAGFDARLFWALIMTMPVYFWSGISFHTNAWKTLRRGSANMDVLIHLGTSVAFFGQLESHLPESFPHSQKFSLKQSMYFLTESYS